VFLGDIGSYGLGAALGGLALMLLAYGLPPEAALGPLAIPLADTGVTLSRRVLRGDVWYLPHRTHAYQKLTDSGLSHLAVSTLVLLLVLTCSLLGAVSMSASRLGRFSADVAILGLIALYLESPVLRNRANRTDQALLHT
jgi:UDP-GlcNAc:undecaprenyl-phosphate GlcNAc-1-phosphate transferase